MKIKGRFLLPIIILSVIVLSACSSSGEQSSGSGGGSGEETYRLTMNVTFPPVTDENEPKYAATEKFAELVNERTDGRVEVDVYFSGQLASADQTLDALKSGTIDMAGAGSYWGETIATNDFPWLPFAFYGPNHMSHVLNETEIGEIYEGNLEEQGVKVLMYWPSGNEGIISKEPVKSIEDMSGKTFRLGSGIWAKWYEEMGAAPANISGGEQYEALMRGTIDGAMYPFYALDTHNLHEVADHITVPGVLDPVLVATYINLDKWNSLPEDIQQTIEEVSKEMEELAFENSVKMDEAALELAQEHGVEIHQLTREEFQKFIDSSQVVWDEFAARNEDTKRIVELLKEDQKEYLENNPDAQEWLDKWLVD
ncbi:TRAP transporter substrate-binding protein [Oceanobacillus senegalensis]|uniref:TRAP transporter substrate-binding protein n=1 Tax=Oceanobacillus senegalensis TaxID=1936063 RepID=UPI000A30ED29|nr:TRAP transporter substrate-binding protein [Oceanobacillus senegalensis]